MTTATRMAGRKKENFDRDRIELRAPAEWIARVAAVAETLGLSLSAYIRLAVNERVQRDQAAAAAAPPSPPPRSRRRQRPPG
jgi:hypothetical protein